MKARTASSSETIRTKCGMVQPMVETAKMSRGHMMCIGNHIPSNVPLDAVKKYLGFSIEIGFGQ